VARHNAAGVPKSRSLDRTLRGLWSLPRPVKNAVRRLVPRGARGWALEAKNKNLARPPLAAATRRRIVDPLRDDLLDLQELIGRDLSAWLDA
jgi:hypothetical protein